MAQKTCEVIANPREREPFWRHPDAPFLIYDGDCGFCVVWIGYWKKDVLFITLIGAVVVAALTVFAVRTLSNQG